VDFNPLGVSAMARRTHIPHRGAILAALLLLLPLAGGASQIAHWNFDDGTATDVSPSSYDLTAVGGGADLSAGYARFSGSEASAAYLELAGFGANPTWTVALRLRSQGTLDQGAYQGIFSNNTSSSASFSWQIESFGGVYQFRSQAGVHVIGTTAALDTWDEIVIRKLSSGDADIWFNGVQVESSLGANPGGLQFFRLGTNRNTSAFWQGDLDDVQVYDSVEAPIGLFGGAPVPEPSTAGMLGLGLVGLARVGRRREVALGA
jgi:hypothetical protein